MKLSLRHLPRKGNTQAAPSRLQLLCTKLAQNTLTEFRVGFEAGEFLSKRDVQHLLRVVEEQYLHKLSTDKFSCLEGIRIGWRLPRFALGPILQKVLPMLLQQPAEVKYLQLMLDSFVPLTTLKYLVSSPTLKTLEIRSTRVQIRAMSDPRHDRRRPHSPIRALTDSSTSGEGSIVLAQTNVLAVIPYLSDSIQTLVLADCDFRSYHLPDLIPLLRKRRNVRTLSLRHNRSLELDGWEKELFYELPYMGSLDLSICDLDVADGFALANALEETVKRHDRQFNLKRLSLAGNFRISMSIPRLVDVVASRLVELDLSYCDIQNKIQGAVFDTLAENRQCTLRSLRMHAIRVKHADPLIRCIRQNRSLERLILDHPKEPYPVARSVVAKIAEAVKHNYYLQVIRIDVHHDQKPHILVGMQYWLDLNRCGRSIVLQDPRKSWTNVVHNAVVLNDVDKLYWILRNGSWQF